MIRAGRPPRGSAGRVPAAATGLGAAGLTSIWAISSGQTGLAIALALVAALGAVATAVVPQNSRDRVEWTRTILDYRLHRGRDRAALRLAQARLNADRLQLPAQEAVPLAAIQATAVEPPEPAVGRDDAPATTPAG